MDSATQDSIPACTRPPIRKIRGQMFGRPTILDVCQYHFDKMPEDLKPNNFCGPVCGDFPAESDRGREVMMEYLNQEKVIEFTCKGCGAILVRNHERDGAVGLLMRGLGIDLLVIRDHLNNCDFRRTVA
jgi:hypothetical protein